MDTRLFIAPGYRFKVIDAMVTNVHLPKSTLVMLVSALVGKERIMQAYRHAIDEKYRFFSYGDACFLERTRHHNETENNRRSGAPRRNDAQSRCGANAGVHARGYLRYRQGDDA